VYLAAYTHVHVVAHTRERKVLDCDNFIVPLLSAALRVTFPARVIFRDSTVATAMLCAVARRAVAPAYQSDSRPGSGRIPAAQGYPEKQSRKTSTR
jgi:hypothetical protein